MRQSNAIFGDPLPILLDRVKSAFDQLDESTRLEAVSATIPVYERMRGLRDRIANHSGAAFMTVVGWLREGRFAFAFEICAETMIIVALVVETPPPDDPDGAVQFLVYLNGRVRTLSVAYPAPVLSQAVAPGETQDVCVPAADRRPTADVGQTDRSRTAGANTMPIAVISAHPADLVRALADVLLMARSAMMILGKGASAGLSVSPAGVVLRGNRVGLADALATTRGLLRRARGALSVATVRAAERLCRRTRAVNPAGETRALTYEGLLGSPRPTLFRREGLTSAKPSSTPGRDTLRARSLIDRAHRDLESALADCAIDGIWIAPLARGRDYAATIADLRGAPPQAFGWPTSIKVGSQDAEEPHEETTHREIDDVYVLTIDRPIGETGRSVFFPEIRREENDCDDRNASDDG